MFTAPDFLRRAVSINPLEELIIISTNGYLCHRRREVAYPISLAVLVRTSVKIMLIGIGYELK